MKEEDDVRIACAVELIELVGGPRELKRIRRDIGIDRDQEHVAVAETVRRIPVQAVRRSFGRHQLRHRRQGVVQALLPIAIARRPGGHVVIADREKVRNVGARQLLDDRGKAHVPHAAVDAAQDRVARLDDEPHRERRRRKLSGFRQHRVDQRTMLRVNDLPVAGDARSGSAAGVAVCDERKARHPGRGGLRWKRSGRRIDWLHRDDWQRCWWRCRCRGLHGHGLLCGNGGADEEHAQKHELSHRRMLTLGSIGASYPS